MSYSYIYSYTLKLYTAVLQYSLASYIAIAIVTIGVSDGVCIPCVGGSYPSLRASRLYIDFEIWSICLLENLCKNFIVFGITIMASIYPHAPSGLT